jgi:hypothetical protein
MLKRKFSLTKFALVSATATVIAGTNVQAAPICSVSWHPSICRLYRPHRTRVRYVSHRHMHRHRHQFVGAAAEGEYGRNGGYVEPSSSIGQDASPTQAYAPAYPSTPPASLGTVYPPTNPPAPPPALGPTYNFYGPTTNFFGPPLPIVSYRHDGPTMQNYDRLDPWHGYDPYNGLENGY